MFFTSDSAFPESEVFICKGHRVGKGLIFVGLLTVSKLKNLALIFYRVDSAVARIIPIPGINFATVCRTGYSYITSYVLFAISSVHHRRSSDAQLLNQWQHRGLVRAYLGPPQNMSDSGVCLCFALFGAVSRSGMAVMRCLTPILFPRIRERKFPVEAMAAVMCCAASLGLLIPPALLR